MNAPAQTNAKAQAEAGRSHYWSASGAALLFLAWLFFPLAQGWLKSSPPGASLATLEVAERPVRHGRPLADYLHDFSAYYEKSHPVRPLLLPIFSAFKLYALGVSSVSSVIVGRERWLFLGKETAKIDEGRYFMGTHPFDGETLELWLQSLSERRRWLERMGISYWLVVAPNKSTIYPEFLPRSYPRNRSTRMDQLVAYLSQRDPGFPLVDLRPVLKAGKKAGLVYWPLDTHWNDFGSDLAYREIIRQMSARFPSLEALPEDAFEIKPSNKNNFDLKNFLLLPWETPGPSFRLAPKRRLPAIRVPAPNRTAAAGVAVYRSNKGAIPLALFIHDSFGEALKPLLGSHFRKSKWILDRSHELPAAWIEKKRPRVVIDEIVERYFDEDPWTNPEQIRK